MRRHSSGRTAPSHTSGACSVDLMPTYSNPYTKIVLDAVEERTDYSIFTAQDRMYLPTYFVKGADNLCKTWGPWELRCVEVDGKECYELYHEAAQYSIHLNDIDCMADIFDWILHISGKGSTFFGEDHVYFLGRAFRDIFNHSDINITSTEFAKSDRVSGEKIAKKYFRAMNKYRNVSLRTRHKVLERDDFRCQDCGASPAMGAVLEVDHTIPVSKGGTNDMSNLRTLCADCNRGKSDRIVNYNSSADAAPPA